MRRYTVTLVYVILNYLFSVVVPTSYSPTRLVCPSPENVTLDLGDVVTLQVSLNGGISFISSNVTISAVSCVSIKYKMSLTFDCVSIAFKRIVDGTPWHN